MGDLQQVDIEMADISPDPTNAAPGVSTEDIPATQPCFSMDRLWAILWWIAAWPWAILQRAAVGVWTVIRTVTGICSATIWMWTMLCIMTSTVWAGLHSAAIWMWTMFGNVATTLPYMKRLVMIIILDIFLGSLDISSDTVNGCFFLNGSEWWEKSLICSFK